jgi:antitoxin HicB
VPLVPSDGLRYPVLLERLEYDGEVEYSATVPDLPGCVAAGDSPEEAVASVQDAIQRWIADARQRGLPIPEPRRHSGRFTVRVPSWLHAELETLAELENVSLNQYVSSVLAEHVGTRGRPSHWRLLGEIARGAPFAVVPMLNSNVASAPCDLGGPESRYAAGTGLSGWLGPEKRRFALLEGVPTP